MRGLKFFWLGLALVVGLILSSPVVSWEHYPRPVNFVFVIDISGSMGEIADAHRTKLAVVKATVHDFVEIAERVKMYDQRGDRASLITFEGNANVKFETSSFKRLDDEVSNLAPAGMTSIEAALIKAKEMVKKEDYKGKFRHCIWLYSDGWENIGNARSVWEDPKKRGYFVDSNGLVSPIYTFGVKDKEQAKDSKDDKKQSGGHELLLDITYQRWESRHSDLPQQEKMLRERDYHFLIEDCYDFSRRSGSL